MISRRLNGSLGRQKIKKKVGKAIKRGTVVGVLEYLRQSWDVYIYVSVCVRFEVEYSSLSNVLYNHQLLTLDQFHKYIHLYIYIYTLSLLF